MPRRWYKKKFQEGRRFNVIDYRATTPESAYNNVKT